MNSIRNMFNSEDWWDAVTNEEFQQVFRMSKETVIDLQVEIDYSDNVNEERVDNMLLVCLWFLGTTRSLEKAKKLFKVEINEKDFETYLLKILKLAETYIVWPEIEEAKLIENGFIKDYKIPNVLGVIGSLYIEVNINELEENANKYYNEVMDKHAIVLQVVCDNNLLLRDICIGCPGGKSIKQILEFSPLFTLLNDNNSFLCTHNLHLLGGTEHPQLNTLLTPYKFTSSNELTAEQHQFNELHSSVMNVVEKTFRCLEIRFPRLTSVDYLNVELANLVAGCICVLHNFTRIRNDYF